MAFSGETLALSVESALVADTLAPAVPWDPGWPLLPWATAFDSYSPPIEGNVRAFAEELARGAGARALDFLDVLTATLFHRTDRRIRIEGNAQRPEETLAARVGACRDLTVLFLECCRALGIEGRFVSGYQALADTRDGARHLHAWPEVHLPNFGPRGYDPTHGIPVGDGHLPLCRAPSQLETMPIEGGLTFSGPELTSALTFGVQVSTS